MPLRPTDLASDAQISATTGFSGLLAQEMAARHNALENAGAEAAEGGKGASEASTTSAVEPNLPLDSSVGSAGAETRENALAIRVGVSSTAAETVPELANSLVTRHPNSANSARLLSAASETHSKGSDRAKVDDRAAVSEFAPIGDPADIRTRSRIDDQQRDQSVPDGAPQMEIAASPVAATANPYCRCATVATGAEPGRNARDAAVSRGSDVVRHKQRQEGHCYRCQR